MSSLTNFFLLFVLAFASLAFAETNEEQDKKVTARAIPAEAFPPPFDTVPWIQDRTDFCVCFETEFLELLGFEDSCIDFEQDYTWLWETVYQYFPNSCLGGCPCGLIPTDECFDVFNCAPLSCQNVSRAFYTGLNGTLGVGACSAGEETCLNGTATVTVPEVVPQPEVCSDQTLDANCNGFPGCQDMECFLDSACLNSTVEICFDQLMPPCSEPYCDGLSRECYTGPGGTLGVGECAFGTETCNNGSASMCIGEVTPQTETCDGLDNDCDGVVDNAANLTSDPLNCGACGVPADDSNECTLDLCVNGTVINDAAPLNGQNCSGGLGVCFDGNCTLCDTVFNMDIQNSGEFPLGKTIFEINADFFLCPGSNGTIWHNGFGPVKQVYIEGTNHAFFWFRSLEVNATGDCVVNPDWNDETNPDYGGDPFDCIDEGGYTSEGLCVEESTRPIATITPGTRFGTCSIFVLAEAMKDDEVFFPSDTKESNCAPRFRNTTQEPSVALFKVEDVTIAQDVTEFTRCPIDAQFAVSLEIIYTPMMILEATFDFYYLDIADPVAVVVNRNDYFPTANQFCSQQSTTNVYCQSISASAVPPEAISVFRSNDDLDFNLFPPNTSCRVVVYCPFDSAPSEFSVVPFTYYLATMSRAGSYGSILTYPRNVYETKTTTIAFVNGTTPEPSCADGILNQGEEQIDCGGPICVPCNSRCGTVEMFTTVTQDEYAPGRFVITIDADFWLCPGTNATILSSALVPWKISEFDEGTRRSAFIFPIEFNATGDCTINPEWGLPTNYNPGFSPPSYDNCNSLGGNDVEGFCIPDPVEPAAFITPGTQTGSCRIFLLGESSLLETAEEFYNTNRDFNCPPRLRNSTLEPHNALFLIDDETVATDTATFTRCPISSIWSVSVERAPIPMFTFDITYDFYYEDISDPVAVTIDIEAVFPTINSCSLLSSNNPACTRLGSEFLWNFRGMAVDVDFNNFPLGTACQVVTRCGFSSAPSPASAEVDVLLVSSGDGSAGRVAQALDFYGDAMIYEQRALNITYDGSSIITPPSCADGILNQDEELIDCGGTSCVPCPNVDVLLIQKVTVNETEPQNFLFQIDVAVNNPDNLTLNLYDAGFGPFVVAYGDGLDPANNAFFRPVSILSSGDCIVNPLWGNISNYEGEEYCSYLQYDNGFCDPEDFTVPLATFPATAGNFTCSITINAEAIDGEDVPGSLYPDFGCLPNLDGTKFKDNVLSFYADGRKYQEAVSEFTRCPFDARYSFDVKPNPANNDTVLVTGKFVYYSMVDDVRVGLVREGSELTASTGAVTGESSNPAGCATYTITAPSTDRNAFFSIDSSLFGPGSVCTFSFTYEYAVPVGNASASGVVITDTENLFFPATQSITYIENSEVWYDSFLTNRIVFNGDSFETTPSCSDGIPNQDETDVDCGGSRCVPCSSSLICAVDADCLNRDCNAGTCNN